MKYQELFAELERAKSFGYRETTLGARLIGHVPHVAPEAWLHSIYPGLSDADLQKIEELIGRGIPIEVQDFLRVSNGLNIFSNSVFILGLRRSSERTGDAAWQPFSIETSNTWERPSDLEPNAVVVGGYFDDGSRLIANLDNSIMVRVPKGRSGPVLTEWPNFEEMLLSEARRLSALFDDRGRMLDEDRPTTPP